MIRVLIVDDQFMTRQALRAVVKQDPNLTIIDEADNGVKALELMDRKTIDIALVDLNMPIMDGFEFTQKACRDFPHTKIIVLSGNQDRESIERAIDCGAKGYLIKDTSISEVISTIYHVQRGYLQLGPGLLEKLLAKPNNHGVRHAKNISTEEKSLKSELNLLHQEIYQELSTKLNTQITELKVDVQQGLFDFQSRVMNRLKHGFEIHQSHNHQTDPISIPKEEIESYAKEKVSLLDEKYHKAIAKISQEIVIMKYGITIFFVLFLLERISMRL